MHVLNNTLSLQIEFVLFMFISENVKEKFHIPSIRLHPSCHGIVTGIIVID